MPEPIPFAIAVPTFRRPDRIRSLLLDLDQHVVVPDGFELTGILVVDNDGEPSAEAAVTSVQARFPIRYVHEPTPGIAAARNRAIAELPDARYIAMIDDDEVLVSDWPAGLLRIAEAHEADLVAGPVEPRPSAPVPEWMLRRHLLGRTEHEDGSAPAKVPSGNLLVRRQLAERIDPLFEPAFGLSGGSDTLLCAKVRATGGRIRWSASACTGEVFPAERLTMAWLRRRWLRNGANMVAMDLELASNARERLRRRVRHGVEGAARLLASPALYLAALRGEDRPYRRAMAQRQLVQGYGQVTGAAGRRVHAYGAGGSESAGSA